MSVVIVVVPAYRLVVSSVMASNTSNRERISYSSHLAGTEVGQEVPGRSNPFMLQ